MQVSAYRCYFRTRLTSDLISLRWLAPPVDKRRCFFRLRLIQSLNGLPGLRGYVELVIA